MDKRVTVIGCGNMGRALIAGMIKKLKLPARNICVYDIDRLRLYKIKRNLQVNIADSNRQAVVNADILILAVKPQTIAAVLAEIAPCVSSGQLVISIAAGITTRFIEQRLAGKIPVIRTMPNTPLQVGMGITALYRGKYATRKDLKTAGQLFSALGKTLTAARESLLDAVTAVSGSGPAYVYFFIESLLTAAKQVGLADKEAKVLVCQTVAGALQLLRETGKTPAELRRQVTSPGGTTEAALRVFKRRGFSRIIKEAIVAARMRARELNLVYLDRSR